MLAPDAKGSGADGREDSRGRVGHREDRVLVRQVEHARHTRLVPREQRGDDPDAQVEAADEIPQGAARAHRRTVREAGHGEQAAAGLGDDVVGGSSRQRSGGAEARQ